MRFESLIPNIMVTDVDKSLTLYHKILGFNIFATMPGSEPPFDWVMLGRDGAMLMLQSKPSLSEELPEFTGREPGGALTFFIKVSEADKLFESIKDDVEVIKSPYTSFYNLREFVIKDPDGYFLVFAQDINAEGIPDNMV